ncbi:MAG TPA: hypothetical protein VH302_02455 [Bryobacteraceae bacterium]|nr:hypothetical protein [Bryobacteraceae bacterium]
MPEDLPPPEANNGKEMPANDGTMLSEFDLAWLHEAVGKLAQFLQNPKSLAEAIENGVASGALDSEWKTLTEFLPKSGSFLTIEGDRGRWLVDIAQTAAQQPDAPRPEQAEAAQKEVQQQPQSAPALPDINELSDRIRTIQAVDAEIRQATEERLNLSRVATELRLMDLSPPYEAFADSAASVMSYRGAAPHTQADSPSFSGDVAIVEQYAANFQRASPAIQKAVFLAALLACRDPKGYSPRSFSRALHLLAEELEFSSATPEKIEERLDEVALEIRDALDRLAEFVEYANLPKKPLGPARLVSIIGNARMMDKELPELAPELQDAYYFERATALVLHLRSGLPLRIVNLTELRLRFIEAVPEFHGNPDELPLHVYGRALASAMYYGSFGFSLALLLKLGFSEYVRAKLAQRAPGFAERLPDQDVRLYEDLYEEAAKSGTRPKQVLVVAHEPFPQWRPSRRYAALLVPTKEVEEGLLRNWQALFGDLPAFNIWIHAKDQQLPKAGLEPLGRIPPVYDYTDAQSVDDVIEGGLKITL